MVVYLSPTGHCHRQSDCIPGKCPLNLRITSNSVMNGFFIPALGSQIYAMPGMQTRLHLIAGETGTFNGISSSYSGRAFPA